MNQHLQAIADLINQAENFPGEARAIISDALKNANKELEITAFKLERTEKVKRTTAILLEETIEELEQKRKAIEAQNRELEIEASLERVRSRTMAMNRSDEIHEVVRTLRHELFGLNLVGITGATICLQQRDGQVRFWDITDVETTGRYGWDILFDIDKLDPQIYIKRMWVAKDKIIAAEQDSDDLKRTLTWLSTYDKKTADEITKLLEENNIQHGWHRAVRLAEGLLITDFANEPPSEIDNILLKIGSAFDLAYTRFQDLQNAEAQAREAQIEAALERIRATTMAMHKSDELLQTSQVLFDQFKLLGEHADQLTIGMINESEGVVEIYATVQGEPLPTVFRHPISDPHVMSKVFKTWKEGERSLILELSANELESYNRFRNELVGKQVFTTHVAPDEKRVIYCSYFSKGMLAFGDNVQPRPETRDILDRFSKVFDQTYTRFLDLQKAEAHAKQAERDLVEIKTARQKAEHALAELQATQQQLIQSEKMASLGELTAGIAHEIQNPLNFVNNFSELNRELLAELKEELGTGNFASAAQLAEDIEGNEEKINFHGKRADSIVKSMLQHSKVSTGTKEPTDINALAEEFLRLSFHGFRAKDKSFNATVNTTFDESIGKVEVMPQDIGRVLLNLFNNSFYAVNEKKKKSREYYEPVVQVITVKTPSGIEIKVKDNGIGIPEKVINKIYQPFFTTKPTGEGTGLGLSLSYDIITKGHGGDMKVLTKEGEGSTFIIELPL